jgi:hypothetical protein
MGWVRNVVLMSVYLGLEKPQGRDSGWGARWAGEGNTGISLRATQGRGGRILSQQGGFQVSGKGNKGSEGIIMYIIYLSYVYYGMIAAVNDTSCIYMHNNNNRNECC